MSTSAHEPRGRITVELTYWQASALLVAAQAMRFDCPEVTTATQRAAKKLARALSKEQRK